MATDESTPSITRRQMLAGTSAAALGATSGCIQRVRSIVNRSSPSTASVTIRTPPSDDDGVATAIANSYASNLQEVGIETEVEFTPYVEFYREILLNSNFEIFVSRLPPLSDPIDLRPYLHSKFGPEPGWQNPYGYANITFDEHLEALRTARGSLRHSLGRKVIEQFTQEQPFITIGYQYPLRAMNSTTVTGWDQYDPHTPLAYFGLEAGQSADTADTLEISVTDARITQNVNPLSVEYREFGTFTGLLYDPLTYQIDGDSIPWQAENIDWVQSEVETTATVTLRPETHWHDGTPIDAADVAFTYRFLTDTSLGDETVSAPAPRFRGETSLVEHLNVLSDDTIEFSFGETNLNVAKKAMTVPLLPEHIWREYTDPAEISGIESTERVTEALVTENDDPIGSGPLRFDEIDTSSSIKLVRWEDHFLHSAPDNEHEDLFGEGFPVDHVEIRAAPSHDTAIEVLRNGDIDATDARLSPAGAVNVENDPGLSLQTSETARYAYQVGFNTAVEPFSNPHFRRLMARLLDKTYIVEEIFEDYGEPVANPFAGTGWNPPELEFDGQDPEVPFLGSNGEVDIAAARAAFQSHGFEFTDDESLVLR